MVSSIFSLFPLQVLEKFDSDILEFWIFSELAILEYFLTWNLKHSRIPVHAYFQRNIYHIYYLIEFWITIDVSLAHDVNDRKISQNLQPLIKHTHDYYFYSDSDWGNHEIYLLNLESWNDYLENYSEWTGQKGTWNQLSHKFTVIIYILNLCVLLCIILNTNKCSKIRLVIIYPLCMYTRITKYDGKFLRNFALS